MNNIPKQEQQPQVQIYWQPVAVPNHNAIIQNLQRQNALLKQQLALLQQQQVYHQRHPTTASQHSTLSSTTRSQQPTFCMSPRVMQHQRLFSNLSPQNGNFLSPRANMTCKQSTIIEQQKHFKSPQMCRSKQNRCENQQSQSTWNTHEKRISGFFKMNSPQIPVKSPQKNMQMRSPVRHSYLNNMKEELQQKQHIGRVRSPSFLRNKRKISTPFPNALTLNQHGKMAESGWQEPALNRTVSHTYSIQPTKNDHEKEISRSKSPIMPVRDEERGRMSTVELSADSESKISIDNAVRQFKKKGKYDRRDTFLFEMEQKLDTLYGVNESL